MDWSRSQNSIRSRSLDWGQNLNLNLKAKWYIFDVFLLGGFILLFVVGADLLAALNNPRTAGGLECFGKMICVKPWSGFQFAAVGFTVRCLRLTKNFFLPLLSPEAR